MKWNAFKKQEQPATATEEYSVQKCPMEKPPLNLAGHPKVSVQDVWYTTKESTGYAEPLDITGRILIDGKEYKFRANEESFGIAPKVSDDVLASYNLRMSIADELDRCKLNSVMVLIGQGRSDPTYIPAFCRIGNEDIDYACNYDYSRDSVNYFLKANDSAEEIYPRRCLFDYVVNYTRNYCREREYIFLTKAEQNKLEKAKSLRTMDIE